MNRSIKQTSNKIFHFANGSTLAWFWHILCKVICAVLVCKMSIYCKYNFSQLSNKSSKLQNNKAIYVKSRQFSQNENLVERMQLFHDIILQRFCRLLSKCNQKRAWESQTETEARLHPVVCHALALPRLFPMGFRSDALPMRTAEINYTPKCYNVGTHTTIHGSTHG